MWEVYRDGNVKAYKQFESVPSPNYHYENYTKFNRLNLLISTNVLCEHPILYA